MYSDDIFDDVCENVMSMYAISNTEREDEHGNWISKRVYVRAQKGWSDELNEEAVYERLRLKCLHIVGDYEEYILEQAYPNQKVSKKEFQTKICEGKKASCVKGQLATIKSRPDNVSPDHDMDDGIPDIETMVKQSKLNSHNEL